MNKPTEVRRSKVAAVVAGVALALAVSAQASPVFEVKVVFGGMPAECASLSIDAPMCTEIETPFGSIWIVWDQ